MFLIQYINIYIYARVFISLTCLRTRMSLCNSRGSAIRRRLVRVINKMVLDAATQYFVKCNNNLCRDRIYNMRGEKTREYVDR